MPGLNQRGPEGQGPMTGRRMGRCTNFGEKANSRASREKEDIDERSGENYPDDITPGGYGRGRAGRGPGRGMGRMNRFRGGF